MLVVYYKPLGSRVGIVDNTPSAIHNFLRCADKKLTKDQHDRLENLINSFVIRGYNRRYVENRIISAIFGYTGK